MGITAFAVRRWQLTLVAFLLLAMLGVSAFLSILRSVDPHFPISNSIVTVVLPGADASDMEETVAKPLEEVLQGLDHVREIRSTSTDGTAVVVVEFEHGTDAEQSLNRVVREVGSIRDRLPQGIARIAYRRPRTTEAGVLQLALVSDGASWRRMVKYAQDLRDRLNVVAGVRSASIDGAAAPEVRVAIDDGRLAEARLPASAVANAVAQGGADLPAGSVSAEGRRYNLDAGGAYRSLDAVRGVAVRAGDGAAAARRRCRHGRLVGGRAASPRALQRPPRAVGDGPAEGRGRCRRAARCAGDGDRRLSRRAAARHRAAGRLRSKPRHPAQAGAAVARLHHRAGARADHAVPAGAAAIADRDDLDPLEPGDGRAAAGAARLFAQPDQHLRLHHLAGAAGRRFDRRHREYRAAYPGRREARRRRDQRHEGDRRGGDGRDRRAAVRVPAARLPARGVGRLRARAADGGARHGVELAARVADDHPVCRQPAAARASGRGQSRAAPRDGRHPPLLRAAAGDRAGPPAALVLGRDGAVRRRIRVGAGARLQPLPVGGDALLSRSRRNAGGQQHRRDRTRRARRVGDARPRGGGGEPDGECRARQPADLLQHPATRGACAVRRYLRHDARLGRARKPEAARAPARPAGGLSRRTRDAGQFRERPAAGGARRDSRRRTRSGGAQAGQRSGRGDDGAGAWTARRRLTAGLRPARPRSRPRRRQGGAARRRAGRGTPCAAARDQRRAGEPASRFRDNEGDTWPVTVRLPMADTQPMSALSQVYVPTLAGGSVPLLAVATPQLKSVPPQITRFQLERTVTVTAYNEPGTLTADLTKAVEAKLAAIPLPAGYRFGIGGEAEAASRNFSGLGSIILLATFGILGVLVLEFGRFRETMVVAGVVPLGTVGGLVALLLTGNSLSFLAIIGFVALIGIEIKNSILLVDFTTQLRARGLALREAIEQAGEVRFLPVLLTSVTAIGGLLPLALGGSSLYSPLAWVIIGGLVSSTLLSRIVTPVMYLLAVRRQDAVDKNNDDHRAIDGA